MEYDTAGTFSDAYDCSGTSECTVLTDTSPMVNTHTPPAISNLNSGTTYHYRVRSKDEAGNESIDPSSGDYTFLTQTENRPAKTTKFFAAGSVDAITNASPGSYSFTATTTESSLSTKSAYITLMGIYETTLVSPQVVVQYESEPAVTYALPGTSSGTIRSYFKIVHQVSSVTTSAPSVLLVTPNISTTVYVNSAELGMTYSYTP